MPQGGAMFTYPVTLILLCIAAVCLLAEPFLRRRLFVSVCGALAAIAAMIVGLVHGASLQEVFAALLGLFILSVPALLWGKRGSR